MTDFQRGYQTARLRGDDPRLSLDGESRAFMDGFARYMQEQAWLAGPEDTDSFDH